ncbi:MAG: hypothetical protein KKF12_17180, partial [Proteobacteria bacterium]|nr:hypothetical protein [Pseudomonadota bacterium]
ITDSRDEVWVPCVDEIVIEHDTFLKKGLFLKGRFRNKHKKTMMDFFCRISFFYQKSYVKFDFTILNKNAACHPGGAWDLGDKNSIFFKDLSIIFPLDDTTTGQGFYLRETGPGVNAFKLGSDVLIHQNSSGGQNWQSKNHVDQKNRIPVSFKGYKLFDSGKEIHHGLRSSPFMGVKGNKFFTFCFLENFWQNFPKSMSIKKNRLCLGLFPEAYSSLFELQAGEQKTHSFYWGVQRGPDQYHPVNWAVDPLIPILPGQHYFDVLTRPKPVPIEIPARSKESGIYQKLVDALVDGPDSFWEKNKRVDEYGWRNFGDIFADHESVFNTKQDFISHYNNQYDLVKGSIFQFMRSGSPQWLKMAKQMANHVADIDIYHTQKDKTQFNQGMFWHTDHHLDASTSSHRTISIAHKSQKPQKSFGGGPAPDHNYATGFLYLYWMTGDFRYKDAVLELAENIFNCINEPSTVMELVFQTGRNIGRQIGHKAWGSKFHPPSYAGVYRFDGPGRASGNSLNTLMDAWLLSGEKKYLHQAEKMIVMCVSDKDDPQEMDLLNAELRWMYTVFLQALARYLSIKAEMSDFDWFFEFARRVLIHYATWMAENEYPYLEKPDILEFPNETWAAQDIRKSDVFAFAALYAPVHLKDIFIEKSCFFFNQSMTRLEEFGTKTYTRPLAILLAHGYPRLELLNYPHQTPITAFQKNHMPLKPIMEKMGKAGKFKANIKNFSLKKEIKWIKLQWGALVDR